MALTVDETHLGLPEAAWQRSGHLSTLTPLTPGRPRRVVVVAPHPDDEILGAGGLMQALVAIGVPVEVLAVTDGEGSHPNGTEDRTDRLAAVRPQESRLALRRLGCPVPDVHRLGLPDGRVAAEEESVCEALADRAHPDDLWLAPWALDGHPDHDACGRATTTVGVRCGVRVLSYLVWAWHWADPTGTDLPWEHCRRFELDRTARVRKRWSIEAFASQIRPLGPGPGDAAVLPEPVLARFRRTFEVFVDGSS